MKYNSHTLKKAEKLLDEAGYVLRYEKGNFNAGFCILEHRNIVIVNKYFQTVAKIGALIEIIKGVNIDENKLSDNTRAFYHEISQLTLDNL